MLMLAPFTQWLSAHRATLRVAATVLATVVIVAVGTLAIFAHRPGTSAAARSFAASNSPIANATPGSSLTPGVTVSATPLNPANLNTSQQGCGLSKPGPFSNVLLNGLYPGTKTVPNEVALTFDDGPTSYSTPKVLDALESTHTPATFFVEGQWALQYPDLVRREWNDGFAIGMHSWDHPNLITVSDDALKHQFGDALTQISSVIGGNPCLWLWRPPYGSYNQRILNAAQSYGLTTVNWDVTAFDWELPGTPVIVSNVLTHIHPGAIVLLHDGPAAREQTAAAIQPILDGLRARGLKPVTLPQLMQDSGYPGVFVSTITTTILPTATPAHHE